MNLSFDFIQHNTLISISTLIMCGLFVAIILKKLKIPSITGFIIAGIVLGENVLGIFSYKTLNNFDSIYILALGLMSLTIGAHLDFHRLKNSWRRVFLIAILQMFFTYLSIFIATYILKKELNLSILIASASMSTAPASVIAVIKETRAKGVFVNTVMPIIAINNIVTIIVFGVSASLIADTIHSGIFLIAKHIVVNLIFPLLLGIIVGVILKYFSEKKIDSKKHVLAMVLLAVTFTTGLSEYFGINVMIPNMGIGLFIINTSEFRKTILSVFEEIEYVIIILFFTIAGAHMHIDALKDASVLIFAYFLFRVIGIFIGSFFGANISKMPKRYSKLIGLTLVPQAAIVIGLVMMAKSITRLGDKIDLTFLTTFVLGTVILNELIGPILAKLALTKSGEAGQDKPKLINFIQEEYILPDLKSTTKESVIAELVQFLISSHRASEKLKDEIFRSVIAREKEFSTGIGDGIAIPHGLIDKGPDIWGVIGLSKEGIDFNSFDGSLSHLIVLIVTPRKYKDTLHIAVLQEITKALSSVETRERLFNSKNALEIYNILIQNESSFNYFLENENI